MVHDNTPKKESPYRDPRTWIAVVTLILHIVDRLAGPHW